MQTNEEDTVFLLLKVLSELYTNFNYNLYTEAEKFKTNLKKVSYRLIFFSAKSKLRDESLKLFSILISEYYSEEMGFKEEYATVLSKLLQLPLDVKQWPYVKSKLFFYVCSFLFFHSR